MSDAERLAEIERRLVTYASAVVPQFRRHAKADVTWLLATVREQAQRIAELEADRQAAWQAYYADRLTESLNDMEDMERFAALEADKARLDWLDRTAHLVGDRTMWSVVAGAFTNRSIRTAIDGEMAATVLNPRSSE